MCDIRWNAGERLELKYWSSIATRPHPLHLHIHDPHQLIIKRSTHSRDAVGRTTVNDGSSLRAVGGVSGDGLSDGLAGNSTSSQGGNSSGEGETHFDWNVGFRGMFLGKRAGKAKDMDPTVEKSVGF